VAVGASFAVTDIHSQTFEIQRQPLEVFMGGVVRFVRSVFLLAIALGIAGTLVEATGCVGREAAKAHQRGGISLRWLNHQLVRPSQK
jgi:hypothetical protein